MSAKKIATTKPKTAPKGPKTSPMEPPAPSNIPLAETRNMLLEQITIWLIFGLSALLLYLSGADTSLAQSLYNPESSTAWALRQYGTWPAAILAVASLGCLLWPGLYRTQPQLYRAAAVMLITTVLGAGLLNQVVVQELANRPRPRETVLIEPNAPPPAEFSGNSMPSGHAAMGFVLAAPFFALRRRRPQAAKAFLLAGTAMGLTIGAARMMLGAHFASDVLVAGALTLSTASLVAGAMLRWPRIPRTWLTAAAALATTAIVLGNHFTVTLSHPLPEGFRRFELPCTATTFYSAQAASPTLVVTLSGYGAPLSTLNLKEKQGVIKLQTHYGLYHSLSCTARLNLPIGPYE